MEINTIKRPWEKKVRQGNRYNPDARYRSAAWTRTKQIHKKGFTLTNSGDLLSNLFCIDCYNEGKGKVAMHTVDHHIPVKAGADFHDLKNLRSLCQSHHAKKSANEGKTFK